MIGAVQGARNYQATAAPPTRGSQQPATTGRDVTRSRDSVTVSPIAMMLQKSIQASRESIGRASPDELNALANRALHEVSLLTRTPSSEPQLEGATDAERQSRIEFSRSATRFLDGPNLSVFSPSYGKGNPFHGMDRHDLSAIFHDESGAFTNDERLAAQHEMGRQDGEWSFKVCAHLRAERDATGSTANTEKEILKHYKNLPPVEKNSFINDCISRHDSRFDIGASDDMKDDLNRLAMALLLLIEKSETQPGAQRSASP